MIRKAIKKPIEIEFIQLTEKNIFETYSEVFSRPLLNCKMAEDRWSEYENIVKAEGMKLKTPESGDGTQIASIGDYIIFGHSKDLGRHCWPVKPEYFEKAYDEIK